METNEQRLSTLSDFIPDKYTKGFLLRLIDAIPNIVLLLNEDRRLVYSNHSISQELSIPELDKVFNMRPGEIFKCVNVKNGSDGCGSSPGCQFCGAYKALQNSIKSGSTNSSNCRILSKNDHLTTSHSLKFTSTPFYANDTLFYIVTIEDISAETRKKELEKIFYHDVINSLSGINGVLRLMKDDPKSDPIKYEILSEVYKNLEESIYEQRDFSLAEEGELKPKYTLLNCYEILKSVEFTFKEDKKFESKILISEEAIKLEFLSDPALLKRILTNMAKNALEASKKGDVITLNATVNDETIIFSVHNPAFIPKNSQLLIFERSYTTKGSGRGLGTFSMKLLGENVLKGKVDFTSTPEEGTTFRFCLPYNR